MNEISIFLNGETKHLLAKSVNELLLQEGIDPTARGNAVAINDIIALKDSWNETVLNDGDKVEIVKSFQGG